MEYTPKGDTKRSDVFIVGLFVLGVAFFAAAKLTGNYVFVLQAMGLLALGAAVYLAVRYRLTGFVYVISEDEGEELFTVFRDRGRQKVAQCRLSFSCLRSVRRFADREEMKKELSGRDTYYYTQSMAPPSFVLLVFETTAERDLAVVLECDENFERALKSRITANS